jgi:hypothetical protein
LTKPISKTDAQRIVLDRWRRLPERRRQTSEDAEAFAAECKDVVFETLGDRQKVIFGWIIREMEANPAQPDFYWANLKSRP